jgi:hypothetical protein
MNSEDPQLQMPQGPPVYDNWLALLNDKPTLAIFEFPLLSDARITGEIIEGFGPYQFINPVPITFRPGLIREVIILRAKLCLEFSTPDMKRTNSDRYHGGSFNDELAALSSLSLGLRLKAGGVTRRFEPNGDRFGRPVAYNTLPDPVVIIGSYGLLLPSVVGTHSLLDLEPLGLLPKLTPSDAIALVRAARLYQDALWIGESEPSLSWVMLVSSIETAANHWYKIDDSPIERLRNSKPELIDFLENNCKEGMLSQVAELIADSIGSTKKFVDFIMNFLPSEPPVRPPGFIQHSWDHQEMRRSMRIIYGYRSKALHDGRPFPAPMCEPPMLHPEWKAPAEKSMGLAASAMGGTWLSKDTPMLLHVFEYIVRNSLLNWWKSMIPAI